MGIKKTVMLSLPRPLYRAARVITSNAANEMLRKLSMTVCF